MRRISHSQLRILSTEANNLAAQLMEERGDTKFCFETLQLALKLKIEALEAVGSIEEAMASNLAQLEMDAITKISECRRRLLRSSSQGGPNVPFVDTNAAEAEAEKNADRRFEARKAQLSSTKLISAPFRITAGPGASLSEHNNTEDLYQDKIETAIIMFNTALAAYLWKKPGNSGRAERLFELALVYSGDSEADLSAYHCTHYVFLAAWNNLGHIRFCDRGDAVERLRHSTNPLSLYQTLPETR